MNVFPMEDRLPHGVGRAAYLEITAYPVEQLPCDVDVSDNANLFGAPPAAMRELRALDDGMVARYPGAGSRALRETLAAYAAVPGECIIAGCGSDDLLDAALRAFADPGEAVAFTEPVFGMVPRLASANSLLPVGVPRGADGDIDVPALLATNARIVYICAPDNPTGAPVSMRSLAAILESARGLVVIDEAYIEFCGETNVCEVVRHERALVVRTLSKAWGMAGLRLGYAIGTPAVIHEVGKASRPFTVNALVERAAIATLSEDSDWMRECVRDTVMLRERLALALRDLGCEPLPSATNFLCVPLPQAVTVARRMHELGVRVRAFPWLAGIGPALRVGIGPWPLMQRVLAAFAEARQCV
ncbi:MAG TPA: histidinol-phosphate transaminase [Gemmatimonadaceae bacterium]|nr:histidinol-phosphate transaminase [Gemmatimonadaceae bacterium]